MKDMVKVEKEKDRSSPITCSSDGDYYPYGTEIDLDTKLIGELGIFELDVEDLVEIKAVGFINSKNEHNSSGGEPRKSLSIQITEIKVKRKTEDDDRVKILYKG